MVIWKRSFLVPKVHMVDQYLRLMIRFLYHPENLPWTKESTKEEDYRYSYSAYRFRNLKKYST